MTGAKARRFPRLILAAALAASATFVGWTAIKTTTIELLPSLDVSAAPLIPTQPEFRLRMALREFLVNRGTAAPQSLPSVRLAAAAMPLDERPFLFVGSNDLRLGKATQATALFEAGRRLNPRQRWLHLYLLQLYLHNGDYPAAAEEMSVLSRLVGPAQAAIAGALAQMSIAPETRDAVRYTLRRDLPLEMSVLSALANANVEPSTIFAMASPAAVARAGVPGAWGSALVDRLVAKQDYRAALAVWQRINGLAASSDRPLLYDAGLQGLPGKPPFNWKLESSTLGAVDLRGGAFQINYYGRDAGDLVSQLLVLTPGSYRFSMILSGLQQTAASALTWSVECANQPDRKLLQMPLPNTGSGRRRITGTLAVPDNCPAQLLHLVGSPGEFPSPVSATIEGLQLQRLGKP